jgi:hypothetical protein
MYMAFTLAFTSAPSGRGTIMVFVGGWFEFKSGYPMLEFLTWMSICQSIFISVTKILNVSNKT